MSPYVLLIALSLASTTSDPSKREDQLSEKKCASTHKRMLNFVKYWPPGSNADYIMYNPDKVGFRGYDLLGDVYYRGCREANLAPDKVAAASWYQSAAVVHLPEAQWKLGKMFFEGDGIPQDKSIGLSWITSAAAEGSLQAADYLRSLGEPVPAPVAPNSYTVASLEAQSRLKAARAAERRQIVGDLSRFLVQVGTTYLTAQASLPSTPAPRRPVQSPNITSAPLLTMTRPVYCNSYATASSVGDTVYVHLSQFCH